MSAYVVWRMAFIESLARLRRASTVVTLLLVVAVTWHMVPDPSSGMTMMAIDDARVVYDSSSLGLAGALLVSMLIGLCGFYLVRGTMRADMVSGPGFVIGSTAVGDGVFIVGRWVSAVLYLAVLTLASVAMFLVLHAMRGEGPIHLLTYLQDFGLLTLPIIFFVSSAAVLFDSWPPLMGKGGDLLFFFICVGLLGTSGPLSAHALSPWTWPLMLDFSGIGLGVFGLEHLTHTNGLSIGIASFDDSLVPVHLQAGFWTLQFVMVRAVCALIAILPLVLALVMFHRYSPDRVRRVRGASRWMNALRMTALSRVLSRTLTPVFSIAARTSGITGATLAELGVILAASPIAMLAGVAALLFGSLIAPDRLGMTLFLIVAGWGLIISETGVRAFDAQLDPIVGAARGGPQRHYMTQLLASLTLGALVTLPIFIRWLANGSLRAAALASGLVATTALAGLLGRLAHTARLFVAGYLFALYIAVQSPRAALLDFVGANGSATASGIFGQTLVALVLIAAGFAVNARLSLRGR